jgi:pseudouridine-5'-phosphate glycosidase
MDISADLVELGRTPMGVICAGAKSILDIPRTLEVLETQGVCVAAYGQKEFPAFYTPSSGANVCSTLSTSVLGKDRGMLTRRPLGELTTQLLLLDLSVSHPSLS